jgi:hypothetical protein
MFKIFKFALALLFRRVVMGDLYLIANGKSKVEIKLNFTPQEVWLCLNPPTSDDFFDILIIPNGFALIVDLKSDFRKVRWCAVKYKFR